jgi:hypothetical protein
MRAFITILLGFIAINAADAAIIVYNGVSTNYFTGLGRQSTVVFRSYTARDIASDEFRAVTWGRVNGQKVFFVDSPESVFRGVVIGPDTTTHTFAYQIIQTNDANGLRHSYTFARGKNVPLKIGLGITFPAPRISEGIIRTVETTAAGTVIGQGRTIASFNSKATIEANERPDSVETFILRVIDSLIEQGYSLVVR